MIHADIDPAEIGKNRNADVPIVGDVKAVITDLLEALRRDDVSAAQTLNIDNWWEYLRSVQATYPLSYGPQSDGSLSPEYVIETLGRIAGPDAVYVAGVGQHQMWAAQFIKYENPKTWLNSGGLGTMGYAVPAAMGAKFGRPEAEVWAIDGDGCFQMTNQELATCAVEGAPIKVARHQQRQPGHGAAVADAVLRGALQPDGPVHALATASPTSSSWPRRWAASDCVVSVPKTSRT